jgi:hypothetical protein
MKILNVKLLVLVFIVQIVSSHNSIAALIGPSDWNGDDINGFIATSALPGIETLVTTLDFSGECMYTAIGRESGHKNDIDKAANPGNEALDTLLTFSTSNTSNWGMWDTVNFDNENLFFEDSNGPWNVGLDSFEANDSVGFKLFRLTENATLNYLAGNSSLSLFVGDIIVGFNDNHLKNSDGDYDDIIIAMRATSVPAPGSLALFAVGLFGLVFMKRKISQH